MWHVLFVNEKIDQNWPNMTVTTLPRVGGHHPVPSLNSFGYSNVLGRKAFRLFMIKMMLKKILMISRGGMEMHVAEFGITAPPD